ncbi:MULTISPECIES: MFS transporter [Gammaproteobacteria]|jgi:predicted MFS family arabinose efflux permease|uniref:Predicted arabinose efflux permease, MFS family n=2 Tax=Gammaproteobacteria TaxID=1236 RepID=A0A1N6D2S4_9GAMM|nr:MULTISPECIES: MFS transporter [Gammaproteobacteria]MCE7522783.1 MFS transporter [Alloalcanivorax xenomutans]SDG05480.1 Predicted arabinose efflux permease, MFS family [Idiomarina zobellii]MCG7640281.1 MFS transporter [Alteromonas sp. MmMcT2-2]SIN65029.1 Predicted arabinose efflux permease, MFS family [Halomonas meridiana]SIN75890.1 Predicted arabinose efflux permease, MFS family [Halomonas meridiana]|tara:strand:- start:3094 stop:4305 length:1212 start_codon:yes stop_codon:yes gene_type:complete
MSSNNEMCVPESAPTITTNSNSLIVYLIALGAFALGMASYVTAGLIPLIEQSFGVSVGVAAQLVTAFTLAYGIGSPIVVALLPGNRQRNGLLAALGLFVLSNAASALSTDFYFLLAFRALAGVGSGVYLAMGIAIAASLSSSARGKAIAIIMGGMAAGTVLGVPGGLVLAEKLGWASALWLVTLLGMIAFLGLAWRLPELPSSDAVPLRKKLSLLVDGQVIVVLSVSLLAAIASLGMYTFLAPLMSSSEYGDVDSITPFLWVWGIGGVLGSFLVGPLADRVKGPQMTLAIMLILAISLAILPVVASWNAWLAMVPIILWGAVGWALQVPQNNQLIHVRESKGDGNLAVALNESALYLGSAIGAAAGGMALAMDLPIWALPVGAGAVAVIGAVLQCINVRRIGI